jgi:hypothetical protein
MLKFWLVLGAASSMLNIFDNRVERVELNIQFWTSEESKTWLVGFPRLHALNLVLNRGDDLTYLL